MEEADSIIFETLKTLGCDVNRDEETGEEVKKLGEMKSEVLVMTLGKLLTKIDPSYTLSRLPSNMAGKFRVASDLIEKIRSLGYKGDIGYEGVLWVDEFKVRNILFFLINKLPHQPISQPQPLSGLDILKRRVADNIKTQTWIPPYVVMQHSRHQFKHHPLSIPLHLLQAHQSTSERVYFSQKNLSLDQQVINHNNVNGGEKMNIDDVNSELFSSILHFNLLSLLNQNSSTNRKELASKFFTEVTEAASSYVCKVPSPDASHPTRKTAHFVDKMQSEDDNENMEHINEDGGKDNKKDNKNESFGNKKEENEEIEEMKLLEVKKSLSLTNSRLLSLKTSIHKRKEEVSKMEEENEEKKKKMKTKMKVLKLLPCSQEAVDQLQSMLGEMRMKIRGLEEDWMNEKVQLTQQVECLNESSSNKERDLEDHKQQVHMAKSRLQAVTSQIVENEALHKQLTEKHKRYKTEGSDRQWYNRRILEIVANIHKQHNEIEKIVGAMKELQGEVNRLQGALSRSYVSVDGLLFKAAQNDDTARKSYKMLATLHQRCTEIVGMVEEVGGVRKRMADVQEHLTLAEGSKVAESLKKIEGDLESVRKENLVLMKEFKSLVSQ